MEAVATTGLYPNTAKAQAATEIDAKYGLLQLAARAATPLDANGAAPTNRASYPQADGQQQLIYRGPNNARATPGGQVMSYGGVSRPLEANKLQPARRDDIGKKY